MKYGWLISGLRRRLAVASSFRTEILIPEEQLTEVQFGMCLLPFAKEEQDILYATLPARHPGVVRLSGGRQWWIYARSQNRIEYRTKETPLMAKVLACRDVGMDCDFVARGATEQDVLQKAAAHAKNDHGMTNIPPEVLQKVQAAIHDE